MQPQWKNTFEYVDKVLSKLSSKVHTSSVDSTQKIRLNHFSTSLLLTALSLFKDTQRTQRWERLYKHDFIHLIKHLQQSPSTPPGRKQTTERGPENDTQTLPVPTALTQGQQTIWPFKNK